MTAQLRRNPPKSANMVRRALITGFGPFPGVPENPSARLVGRLGRVLGPLLGRRTHVSTAVLATQWREVPRQLARLSTRIRPDLTLHFGVHERARSLLVEQYARNHAADRPDAAGGRGGGAPIVRFAPPVLASPLDAPAIAAELRRRGLPSEVSRNAGDYLCNMAYFLSLERARMAARPAPALFIHIPPAGVPHIDSDRLLQAALAIVFQAIHQISRNPLHAVPRAPSLAPELLGFGTDRDME